MFAYVKAAVSDVEPCEMSQLASCRNEEMRSPPAPRRAANGEIVHEDPAALVT